MTETGSALDGIVAPIATVAERIADRIADVSSTSEEQSIGVEEVGRSVSGMDEMTQRNAALVEASAEASKSLANQAERLVELVRFFKIGAAEDSQAAA